MVWNQADKNTNLIMEFTLFQNSSLNKIYLSESIRCFGQGLINIFIPIYLLVSGFSLQAVVWFLIIQSIVHILCAIPFGYLGSRMGYKYLILLSIPFYTAFLFLLYNLKTNLYPLYILAIIKEIGGTLFWVGRHSLMGSNSDQGKIGSQIGMMKILTAIADIPAPLIGGIILSFFGIQPLIILVGVIVLFSVIPLLLIKEAWHDRGFSVKNIFTKMHIRNAPIFITHGIDNVVSGDLVWPVYLFLYISFQYIGLGLLSLFYDVVSIISNYFIGKLADKDYERTLRIGAISTFMIWLVRIVIRTPLPVYFVDSISSITDQFIYIPFGATSYRIAKSNHFLQLIVFREIAIHVGKLGALFSVLALGSLKHALVLGLIYSFGYLIFRFWEKNV